MIRLLAGDFRAEVEASRARMRMAAQILDRSYSRDGDGQFSSGGSDTGGDAEQSARDRQAHIDSARRYADVAGALDERINNGDDDATLAPGLDVVGRQTGLSEQVSPIRNAVESGDRERAQALADDLIREQGVSKDAPAGSRSNFDPRSQEPVGAALRQGQPVEVVRPGFKLDLEGESIQIRKAVVDSVD